MTQIGMDSVDQRLGPRRDGLGRRCLTTGARRFPSIGRATAPLPRAPPLKAPRLRDRRS